jgi:hypothetical protein
VAISADATASPRCQHRRGQVNQAIRRTAITAQPSRTIGFAHPLGERVTQRLNAQISRDVLLRSLQAESSVSNGEKFTLPAPK